MEENFKKFHERDFSWSQISSFTYSKEQWYKSYILGEKQVSEELTFGSMIDKKIQDNPSFIPNLPRYPLMQHKMKINLDGINLVGIPDGIDLQSQRKLLADYKTGRVAWTQKKAQETGQLKFYLLLIYITHKIRPEEFDCFIHWLPTKLEEGSDFSRNISLISENEFQTFHVTHTLIDILNFANYIKDIYKEMENYIKDRTVDNLMLA
jgi:hypothetical protein